METLLSNARPDDISTTPFPHLIRKGCLNDVHYRELDQTFLDYSALAHLVGNRNNYAFNIPGVLTLQDPNTAPVWKEFFAYYLSPASFHEFVDHFGDHVRRTYPDLEDQLGKSLRDLIVMPRQPTRDDIPHDADVVIDCQFTFNTPVKKRSRVRGIHVDKTRRLYSGLFYMRPNWDDAEGGHLNVYQFKGDRRFVDGVAVEDAFAEKVGEVRYEPNTLMMFINSPDSLHGVTERAVTPFPRRYINILAEIRVPLFDLSPYQTR